MSLLHAVAEAAGVARVWHDAEGAEHVVADAALAAVLAALGYPADSDSTAEASLTALAQEARQPPAFLSVDVDTPLSLPPSLCGTDNAELQLEDGTTRSLPIVRGVLPGIAEPGYHHLHIGDHELTLAVAPHRCILPHELPGARRKLWGTAIQIPSLHDRPSPYGDFADLRDAVRLLAERGADAVAISPVHAPLPGTSENFSPYSPSSRLFLNAALAELSGTASDDGPALIDWPASLFGRYRALRRSFADLGADQRAHVTAWAGEQGPTLARHALFDALSLHLHEPDWRAWPVEYRNPEARAAAQFAAEHAEDVAFHLYAQWLAHHSLAKVQGETRAAGMTIGLISDLAIGIDPGGSDAWAMQDAMLAGLTIGAPPDLLGPDGQNWNLTGFSPRGLRTSAFAPWIATLRAALRDVGAVRIDHVFGMARLWVVPDGSAASQGAYLAYPFTDMLRIIALESHRAGAIVIGEDLGTRPPGFGEPFAHKGLLGLRVLWFERDWDGAFVEAAQFPKQAVAMTSTHDTATVAGWWTGRDIDWNRRLDRSDWQEDERRRTTDRKALWSVIGGTAPQPDDGDPAPVIEAALAHLGRTPSVLTIIPLEDLLALEEQPNLPGTIHEHPNWRRRLSAPLAALLAEPATARRIAALADARAT